MDTATLLIPKSSQSNSINRTAGGHRFGPYHDILKLVDVDQESKIESNRLAKLIYIEKYHDNFKDINVTLIIVNCAWMTIG